MMIGLRVESRRKKPLSATWPRETACDFQIRQGEFDYGFRPITYDIMVAGDSNSSSPLPKYPHVFVNLQFIDL